METGLLCSALRDAYHLEQFSLNIEEMDETLPIGPGEVAQWGRCLPMS